MACIPIPSVPFPTLPSGITLTPPIPSVEFDAELCCKIAQFEATAPPVSIGVALNPAIAAAITAALQGVQDYLDALPLDCPRE